jgi:F420-non-reducing hydrogenase large subunit
MVKKMTIEPVTRIEGHAKITLDINDTDEILAGQLHVLEIRGFEKFVEQMELVKMPLITARICGVCPAAHHLAAVIAIENGCSISVDDNAKRLRELLYMGHILHSHALSCFVLVGPDILSGIGATPDKRNIFHLVSSNPDLAKKALKLRSIGQRIVEIVGGRGIHPVTAVAGGMASQPTNDEMKTIAQWGKEALVIVEELRPQVIEMLQKIKTVGSAATIDAFPLALSSSGRVDFLGGECRVVDKSLKEQRSFPADRYGDHLVEQVMPGSYMKAVHLKGSDQQRFFVGPLARLLVNDSFSTPKADSLLKDFKKSAQPRFSIIDMIEARLIEMVHCAERIAQIAEMPLDSGKLLKKFELKAGRSIGIVEAPRGILIHDYTSDSDGKITAANLIVATQNNYDAINGAITSLAKHFKPMKDETLLLNGIEFAVRCFDPCLSCATHSSGRVPMIIEVRKNGKTIHKIARNQL